jgi:hypothetical protein
MCRNSTDIRDTFPRHRRLPHLLVACNIQDGGKSGTLGCPQVPVTTSGSHSRFSLLHCRNTSGYGGYGVRIGSPYPMSPAWKALSITRKSSASICRRKSPIFGIAWSAAASPTAASSSARENSVIPNSVTSGSITTSAGWTPIEYSRHSSHACTGNHVDDDATLFQGLEHSKVGHGEIHHHPPIGSFLRALEMFRSG